MVEVKLTKEERDAYESINSLLKDFVKRAEDLDAANGLGFSNSVFSLITRLRQICLDVHLVPPDIIVNLLSNSKVEGMRLSAEEATALVSKLDDLLKVRKIYIYILYKIRVYVHTYIYI